MTEAAFDDEPYVAWAIDGTPAIAKVTLGETVVARSVGEAFRGTIRQRTDPAWLVEEELLGDALRGRGLAPTLQRMALARLDASAHPLVMGTIHAANAPSLRTARRVGRSDVGGWVFVRDPRRDAAWLR